MKQLWRAGRLDPAAYPVGAVDLTPVYGDLDRGGHVGVTPVARYFEHARYAWHMALDLPRLRSPGAVLVVARSAVDHLAPAHLGASVHVRVRVSRLGASSVVEEMAAWQDGACVALAEVVMVHSLAGRGVPLNEALRAAFATGLPPGALSPPASDAAAAPPG